MWHKEMVSCIPTKFGDCIFVKLWYNIFKWSKEMSPNGCMQFCDLVYMPFLKLVIQKIGNKNSGSFKNETENNYYKVITKCDRNLLQKASGITKCVRYYNVWQTVIAKCVRYYKVWQAVITKCVRYYKLRQLSQSET